MAISPAPFPTSAFALRVSGNGIRSAIWQNLLLRLLRRCTGPEYAGVVILMGPCQFCAIWDFPMPPVPCNTSILWLSQSNGSNPFPISCMVSALSTKPGEIGAPVNHKGLTRKSLFEVSLLPLSKRLSIRFDNSICSKDPSWSCACSSWSNADCCTKLELTLKSWLADLESNMVWSKRPTAAVSIARLFLNFDTSSWRHRVHVTRFTASLSKDVPANKDWYLAIIYRNDSIHVWHGPTAWHAALYSLLSSPSESSLIAIKARSRLYSSFVGLR